ncbi:MAG: very short patch repair endonuclease [Verrucomicrobia bacterium]|nr:very short patch repair endonuclease [Verrucomicrobiota bacterium]
MTGRSSRLARSSGSARLGKTEKSVSPSFSPYRATSRQASLTKQKNRSKNTKAELLLRQHIRGFGLHYRICAQFLPGRPDLVFPSAKVVVFCDGDFWHGRHWRRLKANLLKGTNATYWVAKIQANIIRDRRQAGLLRRMGWRVLRFWETDVLRNPDEMARKVKRAVCRNV